MFKIKDIGKMALGSRLRSLSDSLTENAKFIYELYDVPLKPKWFPVFYVLSKEGEMSIVNIANKIGHSHPSVIKIVKELKSKKIVSSKKDKNDARKTNVFLTKYGESIDEKIKVQYEDVDAAVEELLSNNTHDLWKALDEIEFLLSEKPIFKRVLKHKKQRESKSIEIKEYSSKYKTVFKELNKEWIDKFFKMEAADHKALDNPESYIIEKGGVILVALIENTVVGVCALMKVENGKYDYELAKMAVSPLFQGKGIGFVLGNAIIDTAKELGAKSIYLESNTILKPAIKLYQKLGFKKIQGLPSPYERSNIQMELKLRSKRKK